MSLVKKMQEIPTLVAGRGAEYGHPIIDFTRASSMMEPLDEMDDLPLRHAARMICVKLARLIQTPEHEDSWIDIVGYATTAAMIIDRRKGK